MVSGDFNCPGAGSDKLDANLDDVFQRYDFVQHVRDPTHDGGNTLDLLVTPSDDAKLLARVAVRSTCFSDHHTVACRLHQPRDTPTVIRYHVNLEAFQRDVYSSPFYDFSRATSTEGYVR